MTSDQRTQYERIDQVLNAEADKYEDRPGYVVTTGPEGYLLGFSHAMRIVARAPDLAGVIGFTIEAVEDVDVGHDEIDDLITQLREVFD
jgi:hypothetical protein